MSQAKVKIVRREREARRRLTILRQWEAFKADAARTRQLATDRATRDFLRSLPPSQRVSKATLYNWRKRHIGKPGDPLSPRGAASLVDRRSLMIHPLGIRSVVNRIRQIERQLKPALASLESLRTYVESRRPPRAGRAAA